ncbi:hypothetical protein [Streptomyces scabiei]|uniref:hypothetical protein n=1 Tax=Streptomyces scabiei TaxID=1930 RepID=UPI000AE4171E|nr:hypothetical protein [Streptomyces scabiei]
MGRAVGVLRDTSSETAGRRPARDLAAIAELIGGFATPGQQVTFAATPPCPTCRNG